MLYDDEYIARAIAGQYQEYGGEIHLNALQKVLLYILKYGMMACYGIIFVLCHIPVLSSLVETFARTYSRGAVGFFLRGAYYKNKLKRMGKNVFIDVGVTMWEPGNVEIDDYSHIDTYVTILGGRKGHGFVRIGKYVHVASNCVLSGRGGIKIGDYAGISAGCGIYSATNYYENLDNPSGGFKIMSGSAPIDKQYIIEKPVTIDGFCGINSVVLPGVKIGKAAVVGAGSVVTSDIPPFTIAVGSPAKVIKQRPQPERDEAK